MTAVTRATRIISQQEDLALRILNRVSNETAALDVQLDAFEKIGKWVSIKNRLEDEGAGDINRFKERIQGETTEGRHYSPSRRPKGWVDPNTTPPRLEQLKNRLPRPDDGSSGGDSDDNSGKSVASA